MALFKRHKRSRRAGLLSTHGVEVSRADMKRHQRQSWGTGRLLGSWAALMLGGFSCYTAMHYAPSLFGFGKLVDVGGSERESGRFAMSEDGVLAPYADLFKLRRTYLRAGQTLNAQYESRSGAPIDLVVVKCANRPVVEVFHCQPVGRSEVTVRDRSGSREFRFAEAGFYHVAEAAPADATYQVVWRRG